MRKSIQRECSRMDESTFDAVGEEVIHRSMAMSMMKSIPIDMLRRLLPMKISNRDSQVELELKLEI